MLNDKDSLSENGMDHIEDDAAWRCLKSCMISTVLCADGLKRKPGWPLRQQLKQVRGSPKWLVADNQPDRRLWLDAHASHDAQLNVLSTTNHSCCEC